MAEIGKYQADGSILLLKENRTVPADPANRDYRKIQAAIAAGATVAAYRAPPPPSKAERIADIASGGARNAAIVEALFDLANQLRALRGEAPLTRSALLDWMEAKTRAES